MANSNLMEMLPVQFNGPEAEAARERMNKRVEECKAKMGDHYLLHPANHVGPLENSLAAWIKSLPLSVNTAVRKV
jgi:hypothetical protein